MRRSGLSAARSSRIRPDSSGHLVGLSDSSGPCRHQTFKFGQGGWAVVEPAIHANGLMKRHMDARAEEPDQPSTLKAAASRLAIVPAISPAVSKRPVLMLYAEELGAAVVEAFIVL